MPQSLEGKSLDAYSPFARLLVSWGWKQEPPLRTPSEFARRLGIHRQTMWQWLARGVRPQAEMLPQVASKTGIPLADLYAAAGYPVPSTDESARADAESVVALAEQLPPDQLRQVLSQLDAFITRMETDARAMDRKTQQRARPKALAGAIG